MTSQSVSLSTTGTVAAAIVFMFSLILSTAADTISDKFDGVYEGKSELVDPLSKDSCPEQSNFRVTIKEGQIDGQATDREATIRGFVTSDGFFTGDYRLPDGSATRIEGSIEDNSLVGGVIADDQCAWLLKLRKN